MLVLPFSPWPAFAADTWNVTPKGTPSLSDVVNYLLDDGDTVVLGPGTYQADLTLSGLSDIEIAGSGSGVGGTRIVGGSLNPLLFIAGTTNATIRDLGLDGGGGGRVASVRLGSEVSFHGVAFREGADLFGDNGSALWVDTTSSATVDDCEFTDSYSNGRGTLFVEGDAVVTDTRFFANSAGQGAGMYCGADATCDVVDSTFERGAAISGGGIVFYQAAGSVLRTRFCDNESFDAKVGGEGGAIFLDRSTVEITNSLFFDNYAGFGGGGIGMLYTEASIVNNTFVRTTRTAAAQRFNPGSPSSPP